jgi:hypothetical protein
LSDLEGYVVVLREDKKELVFAHLTREPVKLDDYEEFNLPPQSLSAMQAEKNKLEAKIAELTGKAQLIMALSLLFVLTWKNWILTCNIGLPKQIQ